MGNTVCEFNRVFDTISDALCCCDGNNKNHSNNNSCVACLQGMLPCLRGRRRRKPRGGGGGGGYPGDGGFTDNYADVQCAYNDDYTIDTVCIQGQAMILPPNESTIEPFIADLGGSMGEGDLLRGEGGGGGGAIRGSLGGNVIYKQPQQPLNVGLLQYHQGQERSELHHDIR